MNNVFLIALFAPLAGAFLALFVPARDGRTVRSLAIGATFISLAAVLGLFAGFDRHTDAFQFVIRKTWIPELGASFHIGVDGISMTLLLLAGVVAFAGTLVSADIREREKEYYILYLLLATGAMLTLAARDLFLFYVAYEIEVLGSFLLIACWGDLKKAIPGRGKDYAAMKLTLYVTAGAMLTMAGLIFIYIVGGHTFDLPTLLANLHGHPLYQVDQKWLFLALLMGFGVLLSIWPFHTWAPLGYAAAPTGVSMLSAGLIKKLGAYGLLRIAIPLLPEGAREWANLMAGLALVNILYAGWVAMRQHDWKFLLGYSSVSHMGYVLLGLATLNIVGVTGAVMVMFAHGLTVAASFALAGYAERQTSSRSISEMSGLARSMPFIGTCMVMAVLAGCGLPGFANFWGEILVFIGAWQVPSLWFRAATIAAVWGLVLTATYMLWAVRKSYFGPVRRGTGMLADATTLWSKLPYALLLAVSLAVGFAPRLLTDIVKQTFAPPREVTRPTLHAVGRVTDPAHPDLAQNR